MIDIITVVFQDELESLKTQARSLDMYGSNIATIFVVINEDSGLGSKIDPVWWGRYQTHVQVISRSAFATEYSNNGWLTQQVLKLMTSTISAVEYSIILDAKTFFVKSFPELNELTCVGELEIYPVFAGSQKIVNDLFNIKLIKQIGPGGVPFIINNAECREMISWIEQKTAQSFVKWFQQQGLLTEFILYSAWIYFKYGSFSPIYNTEKRSIVPCNLCHSEIDQFDQRIKQMAQATTVSIHRNAWSQMNSAQQKEYNDFLIARNIK